MQRLSLATWQGGYLLVGAQMQKARAAGLRDVSIAKQNPGTRRQMRKELLYQYLFSIDTETGLCRRGASTLV